MEERITQIHKNVFKIEKEINAKKDNSKVVKVKDKKDSDNQFENNLGLKIKTKLQLSKIYNVENKEFRFYQMELFDNEKNLIDIDDFEENRNFYYIKKESKYFYIDKDDLSKLYFYDEESKINKIIGGYEESQITNSEYTTKFYLTEDESKKEEKKEDSTEKKIKVDDKMDDQLSPESKETFLDEIKLNLISDKTISFYGKNNNISQNYLQGYCVKGKLLSKGKKPYLLGFGKEINVKSKEGKYHYIMDNYYIKLTSIKGQYDGAYKNPEKSIDLKVFKSRIIWNNFDDIPKNEIILFEFKNGIGGEKKVIQQAKRYQSTAKFILEGKKFYHIIILAKSSLGDSISNYLDKNKNVLDKFGKFAIICLDDQSKIFGEEISMTISPIDESKNSSKGSKSSKSSKKSKSPKSFEEETKLTLQYLLNYMKKLDESINEMKESIKTIKAQPDDKTTNNL